jgi:Fe-S oxidoreductase
LNPPPNLPLEKGGLEIESPPNPPLEKGGLDKVPLFKGDLGGSNASSSQPATLPIKLWNTLQKSLGVYDFSHEVYRGMHGCLSCKACATQCPIHVDIPEMKAKFLSLYYTRYLRPLRDYFIGNIETLAQWQAVAPGLVNGLSQNPITRWLIQQTLKMVDPPVVSSVTVKQGLAERNAPEFDLDTLANLSDSEKLNEKLNSVILIQDAFTSFYESALVLDTYDLLTKLGYTVYVSPFFPVANPSM